MDAVIQFYMISIGEFKFDNLLASDNSLFIPWTMFIIATFVNCVIFMNMLIAIMGETFSRVND